MKIIDDVGDPALVRAAERWLRRPDPDKLSITELVAPTRISALRRRHFDQIEQPVSELMFALMGSAMHEILHKAQTGNVLSEERMTELVGDSLVTGAIDTFSLEEGGTLKDYKTTSSYALEDGVKPEWEQQVNGYAMLLRRQGFEVKQASIVAMIRDWSRRKAALDSAYPQKQIIKLPAKLWDPIEAESFFGDRTADLSLALIMPEHPLPLCTDEERWARPTVWAVKKRGGKRAISGGLCEDQEDAVALALAKGPDYEIEHRPGENVRCQHYCSVAPFCDWWQKQPKETP